MTPPRWAERLLRSCLPPGLVRDSVLGDMDEEFAARVDSRGLGPARRWYARHALGVALRYLARGPMQPHPSSRETTMYRTVLQSVQHALGSLRHAPAFVLLTTLTLAVGVGATAAIFSVVDAVLLRPLPYPRSEQLVALRWAPEDREMDNHSEPEYWDIAREIDAFSAVATYREGSPILGSATEPERIPVVYGTASLLRLLDVEPRLGRVFSDAEDVPGGGSVVVLSHGLWTRLFGGDPAAIGATVVLEDRPRTVVGVMPEGFAFPGPETQAWLPLGLDREDPVARNNHYLRVIARLAEGSDVEAAAAQLDALGARSTELHPDFYSGRMTFRPYLLRDRMVGDVRTPLLLLLGAVGGVLLIAAVNAASLFLARGEGRRAEIAVRTALGAGRARVASQLLAESVVVSLLAAVAGVALAYLGVAGLARLAPPDLPRVEQIAVDGRVLGFGVLVALGTGLLFGLVPAVQGWRSDVRDVLSAGGRGGIGSRRGGRFRRGLVIVQLTLATMLVLGSTLLLRSFSELRRVDLGFSPEGALVVPLSPGASSVPPNQAAIAFFRQLEDRLAALPGVTAVGSALRVPLVGGHDNYSVRVEGAEAATLGEAPAPGMQWATPGYFAAMGIELRRGRLFTEADDADAAPVAVVNEALARELWPNQDPIGRRLRMWIDPWPWIEIVGVVADVKHYGIGAEASTKLYIPHAQGYVSAYYSPSALSLVVQTDGDAAQLADPVRSVVREAGPAVPIGQVRTMTDIVDAALARDRFTLLLLGLFACVALTLAAVGVYGVTAEAVAARRREIGLRMAIGAAGGAVARGVLRDGLVMAAWGVVLGLAGGLALSRLLRAALYDVSPTDPVAVASTAPTLALVVAIASVVPALRASRLDPVDALRES